MNGGFQLFGALLVTEKEARGVDDKGEARPPEGSPERQGGKNDGLAATAIQRTLSFCLWKHRLSAVRYILIQSSFLPA